MKRTGQAFLDQIIGFPPNTFHGQFLKLSASLGLPLAMDYETLKLLFKATFQAFLCNTAFNGSPRSNGNTQRQTELFRIRLEQDFMAARDALFQSPGWQLLAGADQAQVQSAFLEVFVAESNLKSP